MNTSTPSPVRERLTIGHISMDRVTFAGALEAIGRLVEARQGGYVCTPNVDHFVLAEDFPAFREAYARASLVVADGMPVVWASRLFDAPVPEKVSGSDLMDPLMALAAVKGWRVYLVGAGPGVAEEAAARIRARHGTLVVGTDSPMIRLGATAQESEPVLARIRAAKPDLVMVAFGAPKQEQWMAEVAPHLGPAVLLGVGASLDFVAGRVKRAPQWMSRLGTEWLYRLASEPRRLWRRYLVNDPRFVGILARALRQQARLRGAPAPLGSPPPPASAGPSQGAGLPPAAALPPATALPPAAALPDGQAAAGGRRASA